MINKKRFLLLGNIASKDLILIQELAAQIKKAHPESEICIFSTPATLDIANKVEEFDRIYLFHKDYGKLAFLKNIFLFIKFLAQLRSETFIDTMVIYGHQHCRAYLKYELISIFANAVNRSYQARNMQVVKYESALHHIRKLLKILATHLLLRNFWIFILMVGAAYFRVADWGYSMKRQFSAIPHERA